MTGKVDSFSEIDLMVKGIRKRRFKRMCIKSMSGKIEGMKSFHSLVNTENKS